MKNSFFFIPIAIGINFSCTCNENKTITATTQPQSAKAITPFAISSPAFQNKDTIPVIYTCAGKDISPPLRWNNPFKKTASFALIMDDPDAPGGTFVHWVLYNLPSGDTSLDTNFPKDSLLPGGIKQGITGFGRTGYGGPCPPNEEHRYFFKLYALDTILPIPASKLKKYVLEAMKGHVLAETELMGRYTKK
jgi:Raf kinase inhibitor-like YbhB/YbcL family protein